ncbi:MAG: trypsin-like peptidase domain-containing protein [Candidatus Aureabacteria bacterium]|nr:trypsin-like peptidase domain-containing protein [Candidatus Auribacterota bacterium]
MKTVYSWLAIAVLLIAAGASAEETADDLARIRSAVVKIRNVSQRTDYNSPWRKTDCSDDTASGVIIEGNRILTVAHAVSDSRYLEVEKENSGTPYRAEVAFIGHDCDLALLTVPDKTFFSDTASLSFGDRTPELTSRVSAYGFPTGGRRISVTQGVVSRVDYVIYSHSGRDYHLILQIDAAVNPGNSGGPVLQEGRIAGLAFQAIAGAENIGYVIPLTVIRHFLQDIADGVYDGYPDLGIVYSNLLNDAYRRSLALPAEKSGVVVDAVIPDRAAGERIQPGDILASIDGNVIRNDGNILLDGNRFSLNEVVERKQAGEKVEFRLFREGREISVAIDLRREAEEMSRANVYDREPEYLVYGGFIFEPLTREYLKTWGKNWRDQADKRLLYYYNYYYTDRIYQERPQIIVLLRVLPAPANRYYAGLSDEIVERVNGRKISSLSDLAAAFAGQTGEFHVIDFEDRAAPCVLSAAQVAEENAQILGSYGIERDRNVREAE